MFINHTLFRINVHPRCTHMVPATMHRSRQLGLEVLKRDLYPSQTSMSQFNAEYLDDTLHTVGIDGTQTPIELYTGEAKTVPLRRQ
jgi:hypothetical protein